MIRVVQYYSRFQQARGGVGGLPRWGRAILLVLAAPGLALAALSIALLGVSILALLLLTVPAYRLLRAVTGEAVGGMGRGEEEMIEATVVNRDAASAGRRPIEVKILEP